jgi:cytoskeletal protein CcmA (bactofilin family)
VWTKRIDEPTAANERPEAAPPQAPARERAHHTQEGRGVIGASMRIKGEIHSHEELFIDGEVDGSLELRHALTIGPHGKVQANIKAREVTIFGSVRGNVEVTERIAIRDHGSLIGDIKTAGISIDDGAYFKGSIDIIRPEPRREAVRAAGSPAIGD